jgi:hypothetical protein
MSKKTAGQLLLEKLENETAQINKAMADAKVSSKTKKIAVVVPLVTEVIIEDVTEDVVEDVIEDSNLLKKVQAKLPSLAKLAQFARVIICWEVANLILEFML